MERLGDDPDALRYTYITAPFGPEEARAWVQRYVDGWRDGSRAGFSVQSPDGEFLGMMSIIKLDLAGREGELGYIIARQARGRGVATRALRLLTDWAFDALGLQRAELRINTDNAGSVRVAERSGYTLEGTMRSLHFKNGMRTDTLLYSRLPTDT
jgi:RimJ/RimL family protein N-acetyltransferase